MTHRAKAESNKARLVARVAGVVATAGLIVTMTAGGAGAATVVTRSGTVGGVGGISATCTQNYQGTWYGPLGPLVDVPRAISVPAPKVYGTGTAAQYGALRADPVGQDGRASSLRGLGRPGRSPPHRLQPAGVARSSWGSATADS